MFCFGIGVFMFLVDSFVFELGSSCSWLMVVFWSWCLNVPSWLLCFGVVCHPICCNVIYYKLVVLFFCVYPLQIFYACTVPSNLLWVSEFVFLCTFLCNWFCGAIFEKCCTIPCYWFCVSRFVFLCTFPCYCFCASIFWFLCTVPFSILQSTSTLQEHLSSPPVCSEVRVAQSLVKFLCSV